MQKRKTKTQRMNEIMKQKTNNSCDNQTKTRGKHNGKTKHKGHKKQVENKKNTETKQANKKKSTRNKEDT